MLPAPTLQSALDRTYQMEQVKKPTRLRTRVISVVFARPGQMAIEELKINRKHYDIRTGDAWDLFFAGYYAWTDEPDGEMIDFPDGHRWGFSELRFEQFERDLKRSALQRWEYSEVAELVSFLTHNGPPDWESLHSVRIGDSSMNTGESYGLGEVIKGLFKKNLDELRQDLAPGEHRPGEVTVSGLESSLISASAALGVGLASNVIYDLVKTLIR